MQVHRVELEEIKALRDIYRHEMNCQVIHDSNHVRPAIAVGPVSMLKVRHAAALTGAQFSSEDDTNRAYYANVG
jgi:hypothetical protein